MVYLGGLCDFNNNPDPADLNVLFHIWLGLVVLKGKHLLY